MKPLYERHPDPEDSVKLTSVPVSDAVLNRMTKTLGLPEGSSREDVSAALDRLAVPPVPVDPRRDALIERRIKAAPLALTAHRARVARGGR